MQITRSKIVAIIPARGGSKRIPKKNSLTLSGIPLISYTIRAALQSEAFSEIVVSTDCPTLKSIALNEGVTVDDRPVHLCGDQVMQVEVVYDFLVRRNAIAEFDAVASLLPTCPFRSHEDVRSAVELFLEQTEVDYLLGVTEYDFPAQLALRAENSSVHMVDPKSYQNTRSQNFEKLYHPNGAIYLARVPAFLQTKSFFNEKMLAYRMPAVRSFDIDYPYQFEIAEIMMKRIQEHGHLE